MNKEILKRFKEILTKENKTEKIDISPTTFEESSINQDKKYTIYDGKIFDFDNEYINSKTIQSYSEEEIISKINTNEAISFFNQATKEYIEFLNSKGATYDEIKITIAPAVFASIGFIQEKQKREIAPTKDNMLYDVSPIMLYFSAYRWYEDKRINITQDDENYYYLPKIPKILPNIPENEYHIAKYSDFVKGLNELGYNLNQETFDDMIKYHTENDNTTINNIIIDFTNEKNKQK